ncbi:universal stress protein [Calothrix sp. CCY 0018]|uniref:universal stress protein n=1 Tax=Calothrix sp. CCY 0018 TaxID=3103864 RepID=UPI0039C6CA26
MFKEQNINDCCSYLEGETEVIANYINAQDISLLLMGAYGYSRIRNLVIGSTTAQLLRGCEGKSNYILYRFV